MDTILQSQVFFFISSVGFVILFAFLAVLLIYVIGAAKKFHKIMDKVEKDIDKIGDTTKEMLEDVRDSSVFRLLSGRRKRNSK